MPSAPNDHPHLLPHLNRALQNLEAIAKQEGIPNVYNLDIQEGSFVSLRASRVSQAIGFLQGLILPKNRERLDQKRVKIQKKLHASINFLKTHYRMIHRYKQGSKEQREWANRALDIIGRYNAGLKKNRPKGLKGYFYEQASLSIIDRELEKNRIEIPAELYMPEAPTLLDRTSEKISSRIKEASLAAAPTATERDIFTMRAITEAGKSDLPQGLQLDLNSMMRQAPISATQTSEEGSSVISLVQTLTPFPGEEIRVEGSFERNEASPVPSVPIPKSFRITKVITQNGFPHPSQNTGFALCNSLLPENPLRMDLLPLFQSLEQRKKETALKLLPEGPLNARAKEILRRKREIFCKRPALWIGKQRELAKALFEAGGAGFEPKLFFDQLRLSSAPFDHLSQTYVLLNQLFIEKPLECLFYRWQEEGLPALYSEKAKERLRASEEILDEMLARVVQHVEAQLSEPQSALEKATLNHLLQAGPLIGRAAKNIFLQALSEKIGFPPPLLKNFEIKIQSCALFQAASFHRELQGSSERQAIEESMEEQLEKETRLFELEACEPKSEALEIAFELERYYLSRARIASYS